MTVAGAEAGANPEGLRVDGGGLGACSQRIWLGVTLCEDVADNHSSPPQRLQVCPILCKVNLHHRGESLQWLYRGSAINTIISLRQKQRHRKIR